MSGNDGDAYARAGVDYNDLDGFKRLAQAGALRTVLPLLTRFGLDIREVPESRGESVYLIEFPTFYLGHVQEGLGTKNRVADLLLIAEAHARARGDRSYGEPTTTNYDSVAQCCVAMIVNDAATAGAEPLSVAMECASGTSDWFKDGMRNNDLVNGWEQAVNLSGAVWGPGETPALKDIICPDTVSLSGSAMCIIPDKKRYIRQRIHDGDAIMFLDGNGVHANGLTLCRQIGDELPEGYLTPVPGTEMNYGQALLARTPIYVPYIRDMLDNGIDIHYAANMTGHGWRKLMRANTDEPFSYEIEVLPEQQAIFEFIQKHGNLSDSDMFGNYNMNGGFAVYVPQRHIDRVKQSVAATSRAQKIAGSPGAVPIKAIEAGRVRRSDETQVLITPKGLRYGPETMQIR